MATQQTARVAKTVADMTAAERDFRAVIEFIVAATMIGTERPRGEVFIAAVIAKARRQLPRILPIGPNDHATIDAANVNYLARHPAGARGLRRKHKQAERRHKVPHQASAMSGAAAEGDVSTVNAARGSRTMKREPSPSLLCTSTVPRCRSTAVLTK